MSPLKIGSRDVKAVKIGSRDIVRIMHGTREIWAAGGAPAPTFEVAATSSGKHDTPVLSATVTLPASVQDGDLIVVHARWIASSGSSFQASIPGFARLVGNTNGGEKGTYYRVADGSEGATVTMTMGGATSYPVAWTAYRITGAATSEAAFIEASTIASSVKAPSLTPSWGSAGTLWLLTVSTRRTDNAFTAPSPFSGQLTEFAGADATGTNAVGRIASAHAIVETATLDPDAWGVTGSTNSLGAYVVAVRPAT